jgi:YbbR domain-containing protein
VEPSTITVVGSPARLDEIGGFISTEPIDLSDVRNSFLRVVNLRFPEGVSPVNTQSAQVTIDVSAITGGQTVQRQVTVRGVDTALHLGVSPETVDIILAGPLPVLQALKVEDVQVIIDLAGRTPGKYKVTPTVVKPESLKVESVVPDTIEVVISK